MAAVESKVCEFGWPAPDFDLPGVDGRRHSLAGVRGPRGLVLMFICNHCPYVQGVQARIVRDCRELQAQGIGAIAVMSNDTHAYPDDSFERMKEIAAAWQLPFPYVLDEDQAVARAYGAQCTPEFYGFNADLQLQYHGRLDESRKEAVPGARRELFDAMVQIARTGEGPSAQVPSIGCSIKWRG